MRTWKGRDGQNRVPSGCESQLYALLLSIPWSALWSLVTEALAFLLPESQATWQGATSL